jgi:hypothetical protein
VIHPATIHAEAERARFLARDLVYVRARYATASGPRLLKRNNRGRIREIRRIADWLIATREPRAYYGD